MTQKVEVNDKKNPRKIHATPKGIGMNVKNNDDFTSFLFIEKRKSLS